MLMIAYAFIVKEWNRLAGTVVWCDANRIYNHLPHIFSLTEIPN